MIRLPADQMGDFVYIPSTLTYAYLEHVLSNYYNTSVTLSDCEFVNLCSGDSDGVSHSGATVLKMTFPLEGSETSVLIKILSPDALNLFKIDHHFDARVFELLLMRWWSQQQLPGIPVVYDIQIDIAWRAFWIIEEYFPSLGIGDDASFDEKHFGTHYRKLEQLMEHVAGLHAHSHQRIDELLRFCAAGMGVEDRQFLHTSTHLVDALSESLSDTSRLLELGLTSAQCAVLERCCTALQDCPHWVHETDIACINSDFSPDNTAVRGAALVSFDWGVAHLGALEEEFRVILPRLKNTSPAEKQQLVAHYLDVYGGLGHRRMDAELFGRQIPWGELRVNVRMTLQHLASLRWIGWQTRSLFLIRHFLDDAAGILERLSKDS